MASRKPRAANLDFWHRARRAHVETFCILDAPGTGPIPLASPYTEGLFLEAQIRGFLCTSPENIRTFRLTFHMQTVSRFYGPKHFNKYVLVKKV